MTLEYYYKLVIHPLIATYLTTLTQYLEQGHCRQAGLITEEPAKEFELKRFGLAPPQMQHVGLRSRRKIRRWTFKVHERFGVKKTILETSKWNISVFS